MKNSIALKEHLEHLIKYGKTCDVCFIAKDALKAAEHQQKEIEALESVAACAGNLMWTEQFGIWDSNIGHSSLKALYKSLQNLMDARNK